MKPLLAFILCALLVGCGTTRYTYKDANGATMSIEFPKEMDAEHFWAEVDPKTGVVKIYAQKISTRNAETIKAQGEAIAKSMTAVGEAAGAGGGAALKKGIGL